MCNSPFEAIDMHTPHKKKFNKGKATNTRESVLLQSTINSIAIFFNFMS